MSIDTSREAVDRLIDDLRVMMRQRDASELVRAIADERDQLRAEVERLTKPSQPVRKLVADVRRTMRAGCGDHSCEFAKPSGMGTNGGCRCWQHVEAAIQSERTAREQAEAAERVAVGLMRLKSERAEQAEARVRELQALIDDSGMSRTCQNAGCQCLNDDDSDDSEAQS